MANQDATKLQSVANPTAGELSPFDATREALRHNQLLENIRPDVFAQIERRIETVQYTPHQVIFDEDEPGSCLYLIAKGSVKISKRGRGGQQETLAHLMERDFFGEMALVDCGRRSAQAEAVDDVIMGRVDADTWDLLLHLAPHEVMHNFMNAVTKRVRQNNQHFIEQMMRTERLSLLGTTISSVVHDMNNPISAILTACELIRRTNPEPGTAKLTGIIRESVDRMRGMTQELIDFSRGNTQLKLQPTSVPDLLKSLEPDLVELRQKLDVQIRQNYEGKFVADLNRLVRVFSNLMRNAREAMQRSERKQLTFEVDRCGEMVCFEISDTGCGIPREILPKIFEPFFSFGKANGTGLGLAITKAVVDAHHGEISATSSGEGTTFLVRLPASPPV